MRTLLTRLLCLTLLYISIAVPSFGAGHYSDVVQDTKGNAMGNVSVTVYDVGTTNPSLIYEDIDLLQAKDNPFLTDAAGLINFYATNGIYDIVLECSVCYGGKSYYFNPAKNTNVSIVDAGSAAASGLDAQFDVSNGNTITGTSESKKLTILGTGGQVANGGVKYQRSDGEWIENCIFGGVEGACNKYVRLNSGKRWGIKNSSNTIILEWDESSGKPTTLTANTEDPSINLTMQEERHWAVAGCQNTTAGHVFDVPTSNAPAATCDTGSNTQKGYLAFDDTTDESFQDSWILPTGFTGAIDVHFRWKAAATSGAVGWCAQLIRVADGSTSDPSFPAQASGNCVSDTAKGTTLQENTATITGVTCTSCAAGDHVYVRISRDANGGAVTDSMTGDAFLLTYGRTWRVVK